MAIGQVETRVGKVRAAEGYVLVRPVDTTDSGIIVVEMGGDVRKGIVLSMGADVSEFHIGDLIYFTKGFDLEPDVVGVHWEHCIAYNSYHDEEEE